MTSERRGDVLRRALWIVLGTATAVSLGILSGLFDPPAATIEASPAQIEDEHDHSTHDHASSLGTDGRFTGPGEVWPPQIKGATDIVTLDFDAEAAATSERALDTDQAAELLTADGGAPLAAALASSEVQAALGERHTIVSVTDDEIVPGSAKGDADEAATLVLAFSHDTRSTVEVYLVGSRIIEVISHRAADEQPPLAVDEKFRAAELARSYWEDAGEASIDGLEGFVILAVQPGGGYYDSRVAYVSFHADNTARPELLTWVDLTGEAVIGAEVDR